MATPRPRLVVIAERQDDPVPVIEAQERNDRSLAWLGVALGVLGIFTPVYLARRQSR